MNAAARNICGRATCMVGLLVLAMTIYSDAMAGILLQADRQMKRGWLLYAVPVAEGTRSLCCYNHSFWKDDRRQAACHLDKPANIWGHRMDTGFTPENLLVFLRYRNGEVDSVLPVTEDCPVDKSGESVTALENVELDEGVAFLHKLFKRHSRYKNSDVAEKTITAISLHRHAAALASLEDIARDTRSHYRKDAITWLGINGGKAGVGIVVDVIKDEPEEDVVESGLMALSQGSLPEGIRLLERFAKSHPSKKIRGQALFWLAQSDHPGAADIVINAVHSANDVEVRRQAVFAVSQLEEEQAVDELLNIVQTSEDREVQREALFWLGQIESPRVLEFFDRVLNE